MKQSEFIVAIDPGSSKIIAMAGKKNEQNIISIIASEKENTDTCIRKACVYNVEETAIKIKKLINRLNSKLLPSEIIKAYVGVGGQSLKTEIYSTSKDVNNGIVTETIIRSLLDECKEYKPELAEILDIVDPEYYVDGRQEMNPIGVQCSKIEGRFKLILGRPSLKHTLQKSISEKAGVQIVGYIIAPIATASAVLTDTEKELGCALIEFGAGVTYLSIYKNKLLKYLISIPLGGNVITKDICNLNILEKEAEELKINFGSALIEFDNNIRIETAKLAEGLYGPKREIELDKLNDIIEARMDEILANVFNLIERSGFSNALGSGIIITGGGAALKNLPESIKSKSGYDVRVATVKKTLVNQAAEISQEYGNSQVIGLLSLGNENCGKIIDTVDNSDTNGQIDIFGKTDIEKVVTTPDPTNTSGKKNIFRKFTKKIEGYSKSLFDEDEE